MRLARHQLACTALGSCVISVYNVQMCEGTFVQGSKADGHHSQAMHSPCSNVRLSNRTRIHCERQVMASNNSTLQLDTENSALAFIFDALSHGTSENPVMHLQRAQHLPVRDDKKTAEMTAASSSQCHADHAWSPSPATSVVRASSLITALA